MRPHGMLRGACHHGSPNFCRQCDIESYPERYQPMNITEKLDSLAELHSQADALAIGKQDLIDQAIPPEVKARLDEIEAELTPAIDAVRQKIADLESEIKIAVILEGNTAKGAHFMAVWNKGRVTWDTKGLDGYLVAHPEIVAFRKVGEPTVSLRKI